MNEQISSAAAKAREAAREADGRYGFQLRNETYVDLVGTATNPDYINRIEGDLDRHQALVELGMAPPIALVSLTDARSRRGIDEYWAQSALASGHGGDTQVPKARIDSSPSQMGGRAATGKRRTYRKSYEVDGWNFRPGGSKTSILRDMDEMGTNTLDVSLDATDENGRTVKMEMRVTKGVNGLWAVTPLGVGGGKADMAAAGMQAILESRRPTQVPAHVGGLAARARENVSSQGIEMSQNLKSTWMHSVGYSESDGMMTMKTLAGKVYGYSVSKEAFAQIAGSTHPGRIYNELIKTQKGQPAKVQAVEVNECGNCRRVSASSRTHRCPLNHAAPTTDIRHSNQVVDSVARSLSDRILRRRKPAKE